MEKDKGTSSYKKPFNPYYKKTEESGQPQPPIHNSVDLNFNEVGMDHFCTFHQEPHFEKICPQWINSMTLVMNKLLDTQLADLEGEQAQTNEPEQTNDETTMVLWDLAPTLGLSEDEQTEENQVSSVNVMTRSKGPVVDGSLLLDKIKKFKENMKKILSTTQKKNLRLTE